MLLGILLLIFWTSLEACGHSTRSCPLQLPRLSSNGNAPIFFKACNVEAEFRDMIFFAAQSNPPVLDRSQRTESTKSYLFSVTKDRIGAMAIGWVRPWQVQIISSDTVGFMCKCG